MAPAIRILRLVALLVALVDHAVASHNFTDKPAPFSALGCVTSRVGDANWVWEPGVGVMPSCNMPVRSEIGSMCLDARGQPDYTSIFVDMQLTASKTGCFAWRAPACAMDLRLVRMITFDADVSHCDRTWAAPLWMSPRPWVNPGRTSGEIDFLEMCPVGVVRTNFAGGGTQEVVGSASGFGSPKHIILTIDSSSDVSAPGTVRTQACDLGAVNCRPSSYYTNFMSTVHSTRAKPHSDPYTLIADIWNGHSGDSGWYGCGAHNDPNSKCRYAVRNIKVFTNAGVPMFNGGKCAALNGDPGGSPRPPSPPPSPRPPSPPPSPTPSGWVLFAGKNCFKGHGGDVVPGDDDVKPYGNLDLARCQAACVAEPVCSGVVVPSNGNPSCWRRARVDVSKCLADPHYNYWARPSSDDSEIIV